ncbi:MAG TPA: PKD domain-containing protein [Candidatus Saccharimonadales bacterium]|nr:PKD domain-containing protein [Candidatus Saccharimonadales bacterium]
MIATMLVGQTASAGIFNPIPPPPPRPGSYGLEATKLQPPPTTAATITSPGNGGSYTTSPITVAGLCTTGLFVQIYDNNVLVGSIDCKNGSFSIQVSLFTGTNDLTATQFDDLGQAGPESNKVTVTYNNADFQAFGTLITLTSNYGRRAANPGDTLTWPLLLSGGNGPYAFSIDWGDGSKPQLKSQALAGEVEISHVYSQAGIYHVTIRVTDVNGVSAFLQVVAIANGKATTVSSTSGNGATRTVVVTKILWIPVVIAVLLLLPAYWLGRRSELVSLHKKLEHDAANFKDL